MGQERTRSGLKRPDGTVGVTHPPSEGSHDEGMEVGSGGRIGSAEQVE